VFNKIDLLASREREALPAGENLVQVSAINGAGLDLLLSRIDAVLTADPISRVEVSIPQSEGRVLAMIEAKGKILNRNYKKDHVHLTIEGPQSLLRQVERFQARR